MPFVAKYSRNSSMTFWEMSTAITSPSIGEAQRRRLRTAYQLNDGLAADVSEMREGTLDDRCSGIREYAVVR